MLPAWINSRLVFLGIFVVTALMMGFGFWLQYAQGLAPCPLCMTQRLFIVATGLTALVAALHGPGRAGIRAYAALAGLFCVVGGAVSSRHVWLQSLPPGEAPACGPDLAYILDAFPLREALKMLLSGDGNCAVVDWSFLGVSIPGWTLVAFVILTGIAAWNVIRPRA